MHEDTSFVLCALSMSPVEEHSSDSQVGKSLDLVLSVEGDSGLAQLEIVVLVPVAVVNFG